jgi:hypothetical protein
MTPPPQQSGVSGDDQDDNLLDYTTPYKSIKTTEAKSLGSKKYEPIYPSVSGDGRDGVREQLAAIEHERWADWQKWMHSVCEPLVGTLDDEALIIPGDLVKRWNRQIATSYEKLSEQEKKSDREQVDRYWPLIERLLDAQYNAGLEAAEARLPKERDEGLTGGNLYQRRNNEFWNRAVYEVRQQIQSLKRKVRD